MMVDYILQKRTETHLHELEQGAGLEIARI